MSKMCLKNMGNKIRNYPRKNSEAGYRVHFSRLKNIRAEVSVMRTHKFLCEIPDSGKKDLKEKFGELAEVVDSSERGSGMWFLIQMVGMGFLFPSAGNKLLLFQEKFGGDFDFGFSVPVPNQIALLKRLQTGVDNITNIEKSFLEIWKVSKKEDLPRVAHQILGRIRSEQNGRKFGGRAKGLNQWVKDIFAEELKCPKISEIEKGEDWIVFNAKFLEWNSNDISSWISQSKIPETSLSDQSFPWIFKNIFPSSQLLGEKPIDLINPYHSLGKLVREFRETTDNLRQVLNNQIPNSFTQKQKLIDLLCDRVAECAKLVPPESVDFLAKDWAEYREMNFSGRLAGWISNFQNRLEQLTEALSDSIHDKELKNLGVPDAVRDYLLKQREDKSFVFKFDLPKDFEKKTFHPRVDAQTGEILEEQELQKFFFWDFIRNRKQSIPKCTKNILKTIRENTDFENIFSESFRRDFEKLEKLCDLLLQKLRVITLGIPDENPNENLGGMVAEYFEYWQPINEFLQKWANEGIPKEKYRPNDEEVEIHIWDNAKKNSDSKPEKYWIAKSLLADKKDLSEDEAENELDCEVIGKWKKYFIPSELPKYPRFLYEAAKDPKSEIENAAKVLPNIIAAAEKFVGAIENQKDGNWEDRNWATTQKLKKKEKSEEKEWQIVWHFGAFHKSLEALLKIAVRAKNPKKIVSFLDSFVEWDDIFFENLKKIRGEELGFDEQKERGKIESTKAEWEKLISEKRIDTERLANFHFYLSGKEYGFARYAAVPTKISSMKEFLAKFEMYFGLQKNGSLLHFLEIQNGGANDNSVTKCELLKFFWARRIMDCADKVRIPDFSDDEIFSKNVLAKLIIGKNEISRADAQRFLIAGLSADLRGKIGTISRKSFLARNVVQITNGGQTLLQFVPREWGNFREFEMPAKNRAQRRRRKLAAKRTAEKKMGGSFGFSENAKRILQDVKITFEGKTNTEIATEIWKKDLNENPDLGKVLAEMPHSWNAILKTKQKIEGVESISTGFFFGKSTDKSIFEMRTAAEKGCFYSVFPIRTSVVQKQFLERFLWGDRDAIFTEKIMGPSVILETEKLIKWENSVPKIEDGETKMFVAIPFQFSKPKTGEIPEERKLEGLEIEIKNSAKKSQRQYRREKNILGIDLGEYGFGFAVFDPRERKFIKNGFYEIPLLQKMRENAASWRDTQSQGIFSRPTTHLADIREKAAGATRNQIHALALEFDAIPIYEDSVDGFEAGGVRISKLYKTLKTSDVIGGNSNAADEMVRKHFWGLSFVQIGGVIGASKTSQTCRACGRCATSEIRDLAGEKVNIENGKITGTDIFCNLPNGEWSKRDVEAAVKKAQRRESEKEKRHRESGRKRRGTIEEFECQICKNVADCDAQAAKNIALKYFFKIMASEEDLEKYKNENGYLKTLEYFLKKSQEEQWKNL